jgi:hypothetical protein
LNQKDGSDCLWADICAQIVTFENSDAITSLLRGKIPLSNKKFPTRIEQVENRDHGQQSVGKEGAILGQGIRNLDEIGSESHRSHDEWS